MELSGTKEIPKKQRKNPFVGLLNFYPLYLCRRCQLLVGMLYSNTTSAQSTHTSTGYIENSLFRVAKPHILSRHYVIKNLFRIVLLLMRTWVTLNFRNLGNILKNKSIKKKLPLNSSSSLMFSFFLFVNVKIRLM